MALASAGFSWCARAFHSLVIVLLTPTGFVWFIRATGADNFYFGPGEMGV